MRASHDLLAALFVLAAAASARAENAAASAELKLTPTFASVGVLIDVAGDENKNATAEMKYRAAGEEAWRAGHVPLRINKSRLATSLFFLKEGTEYEVQVTLADTDGVTKQPDVQKVRTLDSKFPTGSGKTYYADPAAAAGGDGSKEKPFNNVAEALKPLQPGDTVIFAKGLYQLPPTLKCPIAGDEKAWIHLKGEPGAVWTDADPAISGIGKLKWEQHKPDAEGRMIWKTAVKGVTRIQVRRTPGDPASGWFLWGMVKGSRGSYTGQSLADMEADNPAINEHGAFWQDPEALYITLPQGIEDPNKAEWLIAQGPQKGVYFNGHHVILDGLTIEMTPALGVRESGRRFAFRRLTFYGSTPYGLWTGPDALLEDCRFIHTAVWTWLHSRKTKDGKTGWDKIKNGYNDTLMIRGFTGSTFRYCELLGHSNSLASNDACSRGTAGFNDVDIHNSLFRQIGDDAIEPDTKVTNLRIWNNRFEEMHNGVSAAPFHVGPAFVIGNVIVKYEQAAIKMRNVNTAVQCYYHNTTYPGPNGVHCFAPDSEGAANIRTRNNIWVANHYTYYIRPSIVQSHGNTMDMDFNSLGSLTGKQQQWKGEKTIVDGIPVFADREKGDYRLGKDDVKFVDAGTPIPGVNSDVPAPYAFAGKAPDLGAYESSAEPFVVGVREPKKEK